MTIKVAIIGAAGTLGSCTAYRLATEGLVDELVMLGPTQNKIRAHVWDIRTAVAGVQNVKIIEGEDADLAGSQVVIITAGAPWRVIGSRMEKLAENIPIITQLAEKITRWCPQAVIITATNPVDPLNFVLHRYTGLDRRQLLGYTLNDSIRMKAIASNVLGIPSTRIDCMVIGEHGEHAVLLFSSLTVDGKPQNLGEDTINQIAIEHRAALVNSIALGTRWTSGWTSSIGLARMVAAITGKTDEIIPCSVILNGEYGVRDISMSVPAKLGEEGIREIVDLPLTAGESAALHNSSRYLEGIREKLKKTIKI